MKYTKILAVNLVILVALIETVSFLFFKKQIRVIYDEYWQSPASFGRGYPRNHFSAHPERGFDIEPNSKEVIAHQPKEISPYPVRGNEIGCFDHDLSDNNQYKVYLAGDSFTWGYAPLEKKFGTILEKEIGVEVAACGITHTGQTHQLQKFKEVTKRLGYFPEIVFVNVVPNDIDNDFSHPHSTVVMGYQVNNVKIRNINGQPVLEKISINTLAKKLSKNMNLSTNSRFGILDPRKYSASSILMWHALVKPFALRGAILNNCQEIEVYGVAKCFAENVDYGYPINSAIAQNNRDAINSWIVHAKSNGYTLIFADMVTQKFKNELENSISKLKNMQSFCEYIERRGSTCYSFVEYLDDVGIVDWNKVRWKRDGHLNFKGNELYADFLSKIYLKYN